jgi:hypothetical protein
MNTFFTLYKISGDFFAFLTNIGIFGLAAFYIQRIIIHSGNTKLAAYKTELDRKTREMQVDLDNRSKEFQSSLDSKMETYKAELNFSHYKSTKVYENQLNVIKTTYQLLMVLNDNMIILTAVIKHVPSEGEFQHQQVKESQEAHRAHKEFRDFYVANEIFFTEELVKELDTITAEYIKSYVDYTMHLHFGKDESTFSKMREASMAVENNIPPILKRLKSEFRKLLKG